LVCGNHPNNRNDIRKAIEDIKVPEMVLPKDLPAAAKSGKRESMK